MKSIKGRRAVAFLLSLSVLVACFSVLTLKNSFVSAEGVGFSDNFESGLNWELKSGTPSDGEELKVLTGNADNYLQVPSGTDAFYSPKSSVFSNSGQKVYFKTDINLKNTNPASRLSLVYWYKNAENWKAFQIFKDTDDTYQGMALCMTAGIASSKNSSKAQVLSCIMSPTDNGSWRGNKMATLNGGDEWVTLELIIENSESFRVKLTRSGENTEYTMINTPKSGYTLAYRLNDSTALSDAERKAAVFDAFDMRKDGFAVAKIGKNTQPAFIDNFTLRRAAANEDSDSLIAQLTKEKFAGILSKTTETVQVSDKSAVEQALTEFGKLTDNQKSFASAEITKLNSFKYAIFLKEVPSRPTGGDLDPIFFDFENSSDSKYWTVANKTSSNPWGFTENPHKVGLNTSNTAFRVSSNNNSGNIPYYYLHPNYWTKNGTFSELSGKIYSSGASHWGAPISIWYYFKDENNYKRLDLIRENGKWGIRTYFKADGYCSSNGAEIIYKEYLPTDNSADTFEWLSFKFSYSSSKVVFTLTDNDGASTELTLTQNGKCYKTSDLKTEVSEPTVALNSGKFAFGGAGYTDFYVDDINIKFTDSVTNVAQDYLNKWSHVLGRDVNSLTLADKAEVYAAKAAFDELPFDAQLALEKEEKILTKLVERIEDLDLMQRMGVSQAKVEDGFHEDFEGQYANEKWRNKEGKASNSVSSKENSFKVVTDPDNKSNHILEIKGKNTYYRVRDFLWPQMATMTLAKYRVKFNDAKSVFRGTYLYVGYVDENNYSRIYFYRDYDEYYCYRLETCTDGVNNVNPGANLSSDFDFKDWVNVEIEYNPVTLNAIVTLTADSDPKNPVSIKHTMLSPKARLVLASPNGWQYNSADSVWYDDINIDFVKGDWDEDIEITDPVVYYTSNTHIKPGDVTMLYGQNLGNTAVKLEIVRAEDKTDKTGYVLQDYFDEKASEANYSKPLNPELYFIGDVRTLEYIQQSENCFKFEVPSDFEDGVYIVKVTPRYSSANPVYAYINLPRIDYTVGDEGSVATQGGYIRVMGKHIAVDTVSDERVYDADKINAMNLKVKLRSKTGTEYDLPVKSVESQYSLTASVPNNIPKGKYEVTVYNGHGNNSCWSKPYEVEIGSSWTDSRPEEVFNVLDFGADTAIDGNDTPAFVAALDAAAKNGGGTVYVPSGTYTLVWAIAIPENVYLKGDGIETTNVLFSPYKYQFGSLPKHMISAVKNVEISDISFYGQRMGNFIGATCDTENLNIHNIRIQQSPMGGTPTEGSPGQILVSYTELKSLVWSEAELSSWGINFGGKAQNVKIQNNDILYFSSPMRGGKYEYLDCSDNTIFSTNGSWMPFTVKKCVFENNNTRRITYGMHGDGLYLAQNTLGTTIINNREIFTTDGTAFYGENRSGIVKKINDTTYQITTGQSWGDNYWLGNSLYVIQGQGACQVRRIVKSYGNYLVIDSPFVIEPNRNSRVIIHSTRYNMCFIGNDVSTGSNFGTYGTLVGAVYDSNKIHQSEGTGMWAYGDSPNWYNSIVNSHYYDGFFYHSTGENDGSDYMHIQLYAHGFANTSTAVVMRNNLLEDNAYIRLIAPNGKCMLDTVIDNNTIRNSINGLVITSGNNTVNMQSTVISRFNTEDVAVPMSGTYAQLLTSQNSFGYNQLVMYKCGDEVTENFIVGDVNMDGKITMKDATAIKYYIVGIADLDEEQLKRADTNGDGKVTMTDSLLIRRYLLGEAEIGDKTDPDDSSSSSSSKDEGETGGKTDPDDSSTSSSSKDEGETGGKTDPDDSSSSSSSDDSEWLGPF